MRTCVLLIPLFLGCLVVIETAASAARPLSLDDLLALRRISDPQMCPDGRLIAYVVTTVDLAKNATISTIWLTPTDGGPPRQLTSGPKHDRHPRFSPDGHRLLFESDRSGESQLWLIDLAGGEARQLTTIATEAKTGIWSPDGKWIAFVSAVYPEYSAQTYAESDAANKKRKEEIEKNPVKARVFTKLFYRHWDSWVDDKRQHLFAISAEGGEPRDVTPGDLDGYPTSTTFSVGDDFTFTPDSGSLVYTAPPVRDEAWSTNYDLYRVSLNGGMPQNLTAGNLAADSHPRYSPDGKWLAYRAQQRAGYEADRWELLIMPSAGGAARSVTSRVDRSIHDFIWSSDSATIYCTAEQGAGVPLFKLSVSDEKFTEFVSGGTRGSSPRCRCGSSSRPASTRQKKWPLAFLGSRRPARRLGRRLEHPLEPRRPGRRRATSSRCRIPRGSTGFGQKYVDEISGDWGGKCYDDLMAGLAYLEKQPYIDKDRMAAAGASFGGYMMNWFAGNTTKFKTLDHALRRLQLRQHVRDDRRTLVRRVGARRPAVGQEPRVVRKVLAAPLRPEFQDADADHPQRPRLPRARSAKGIQLFTTLQRQGVPSRFINFPRRRPLGAEAGQQLFGFSGGWRSTPSRAESEGRTMRRRRGRYASLWLTSKAPGQRRISTK